VLNVGGEKMECNSLLDTDKELAELYQRRADLVYRLCFIYLKNPVDVEDAVQSVFLKLIKSPMVFNDHEHEKAWLMSTAYLTGFIGGILLCLLCSTWLNIKML